MILGDAQSKQGIGRGRILREGLGEPGGGLEVALLVQGSLAVLVGRDAAGEQQCDPRDERVQQTPAGHGHGYETMTSAHSGTVASGVPSRRRMSISVRMPTIRPFSIAGRHPTRCFRMISAAAPRVAPASTVTRSVDMTSATETPPRRTSTGVEPSFSNTRGVNRW